MDLTVTSALVVVSLSILLVWRALLKAGSASRRLPLPPGPKPLPLVGNALDVPSDLPWRTYAQWANTYGDIIYVNVFGQPMIVLNALEDVVELLEKRSSNYSDRLQTEMITLIGWNWSYTTMPYGQQWRQHRRGFHQYFNQTAVRAYEPQMHESARKLLRRLYNEPEKFAEQIRYQFGANIVSVVYGIEIEEKDDKHIAVAEEAMYALAQGLIPGSFWVDFLPFLKYVPAWVPGAGFQRKAAEWRKSASTMKEMPWTNAIVTCLSTQKDGSVPSVAAGLSQRIINVPGESHAEEEDVVKNISAVAYAGGVDTTVSALHSFFLAMVLYPKVQKRAQEELVRVVGPSRLPEFSDQSSLPYIEAVCKESMRWQPATPLGVAHRCIADDEYKGYRIPKGTLLMQNTWAILHDPQQYPDPEDFKPERFLQNGVLNSSVRDPGVAAFGAGRRICPGRHFSDLVLFINVACILHTFDISHALDSEDRPIPVGPQMTSGVLSHPVPFRCSIEPKSSLAESLILGQEGVKI
ncbi:hypothetical protein CERSUDRAFT_141968 [Gelatoporia subvermispora B]|uniref:Cytochrome P450 n=1 Tax=Ceriporiopsis subvermispora (strain B) TaxID=914234 RepID=M2R416_CERS8|nr:hypothetical protein CERSUDRAFT_141968 [Gelatoporia subvermispora B]